jgi:hypothetical protein
MARSATEELLGGRIATVTSVPATVVNWLAWQQDAPGSTFNLSREK